MLTADALERYRRQIDSGKIGRSGQAKLMSSRVLVIGAGGLGSAAIYYLAAAGFGTIGIVDPDSVELSNLNRQILHFTGDIGKAKTDSARNKLELFNPLIEIRTYPLEIDKENIRCIIEEYDLVLDCVDNLDTRFTVNAACHQGDKLLIEAGVREFEGFVFPILPGMSACFHCLHPDPSEYSSENETVAVIGCTAGVIGTIQAAEALKFILDVNRKPLSAMFYIDLLDMQIDNIEIEKNPECPVCGPGVLS
jgi:molybdopterin/thiamine biosynthesis adenylyltransferase